MSDYRPFWHYRQESDPCQKGTVGCSVDHPVGPETDCECW